VGKYTVQSTQDLTSVQHGDSSAAASC